MWNSAAIEIQWLHEQERQQRPSAHFSFFPDIEFLTSTNHYILYTVPPMWGVRNVFQAKLNPTRILSWENGNGNFRIGLNWCLGELQEIVQDRDIYHAAIHDVTKSHTKDMSWWLNHKTHLILKGFPNFKRMGFQPWPGACRTGFRQWCQYPHYTPLLCFVEPSGANSFRIKNISVAYE